MSSNEINVPAVFAERLKLLRQELNLTKSELGNRLFVSHTTISRWENQVMIPTIDQLYNIAKFFKCTSDYLIGLED